MLVYVARLKVSEVQPYHNNLEKIKSTEEYIALRDSIVENGIRDPVLAIRFPEMIRIETGEQRLLIANELDKKTFKAFVYTKNGGEIDFGYTEQIENTDQVESHFQDTSVPTCVQLVKYIDRGVIEL